MMADIDPSSGYSQPPKKKSYVLWIVLGILAVVMLLMGGCTYAMVGLFKGLGEIADMTENTVTQYETNGMPAADDDIWSMKSEVTAKDIRRLELYVDVAGDFRDTSDATCQTKTSYNTGDSVNGTFAVCTLTATFEKTPASVKVTWRKEDEEWKLLGYNINLAKDPRIEEALEAEEAELEVDTE